MIQYASESINLPGEITFKDVREIFFYQIAKISCFYFLLFCAIFAAVNFINGWPRIVYGSDALNLFMNSMLIIVMSVLFTLLLLLLLYVKFSRAYKKNERMKSKRTYTLNQEGIRICSKNMTSFSIGMKLQLFSNIKISSGSIHQVANILRSPNIFFTPKRR